MSRGETKLARPLDQREPREFFLESTDDGTGAIRRAVIDDEQIGVGSRGADFLDPRTNILRFVVGRGEYKLVCHASSLLPPAAGPPTPNIFPVMLLSAGEHS